MDEQFKLISPRFIPPLDKDFRPAVLANHFFQKELSDSGYKTPLVLGLERSGGLLARYETFVYPEDHPDSRTNFPYVERILKFLLWQKGGWKVYVGGPADIGSFIRSCYSPSGARQFDYHFMG